MAFENRYSLLDKALHRIAFATRKAQFALSDLEMQLFRRDLDKVSLSRPVFITSLPRAGTTLLLDILVNHPDFASHTYRDMPFVMLPLLWNRLSRNFGLDDKPRPRAHGDGMMVSVDSPEAFEEIIWNYFWPNHYNADRIIPWKAENNEEFLAFYRNHLRSIVWLRATSEAGYGRYISKNNLNIARVPYIKNYLPDSIIIIPFRHPVEHAASLLSQHMNFLEIHQQDAFASSYMRDIGHFDFGVNLKPVDFSGWLDRSIYRDATQLGFWIEYWVFAYEYILGELGSGIYPLSYEDFCKQGSDGLKKLMGILETEMTPSLVEQGKRIREPTRHDIDVVNIDDRLLKRADAIYASLKHESCL